MFKKIFRNAAYLSSSKIFSYFLLVIRLSLIARFFGVIGLGKLVFIYAFSQIFFLVIRLGFSVLATRDIARDKSKTNIYLNNFFLIKFIFGIFGYIIAINIINLVTEDSTIRIGVYIYAFFMIISSLREIFNSIFRAFQKMKYESILVITETLLMFIFSMYFLFNGYGIISMVVASCIGIISSFILGIFILIKYFICKYVKPDVSLWNEMIIKSIPFAANNLINPILLNLNIIMIGSLLGNPELGIYGAAHKIIEFLMFFPAIFAISVFPSLSKSFLKSKEILKKFYKKSFFYLSLLILLILIPIILFSEQIILAIYGKEFVSSVIILRLMSIAGLFMYLNIINEILLDATDKPQIYFYIGLIGCIANVSLNLFLIPRFNIYGAISSVIIVFALIFLTESLYIQRNLTKA